MEQPALLEMRDITKEFPGVKALDGVSLTVRPGTVHALMGENGAGKSTLMKCLFGIYAKNSGTIILDGKEVDFKNSKEALENGVAMVHQELNQALTRSVMDNLWLGRYPKTGGIMVSESTMRKRTREVFEELDVHVDPKAIMSTLPVSQRQMVEIAKAVSYNAKVIVFDEPTSSLTEAEVEHLFRIINKLRDRGVAMVYISHKMEEILQISDEVTIMRDGKWIATENAKDLTTDKIIQLMVGRDLTDRFPPKTNKPGEVLLDVRNLTGKYMPTCMDVSFQLRKGEILGVAGLVGSRRTELLETIFGIAHHQSGEMYMHGKKVENKDAKTAIKNGFALLTEERRATGIFGGMSIQFNSVIANIKNYRKGLLLSNAKMKEDTKWVIDSMHVKTPSQKTHIRTLSGGNQQKVILGRWLLTKPEVLLLDEPTRGIDVGAKYEIYCIINDLVAAGKSVIMISSELPEVLGMSDRIYIMNEGKFVGEVGKEEATSELIMSKIVKSGKGA